MSNAINPISLGDGGVCVCVCVWNPTPKLILIIKMCFALETCSLLLSFLLLFFFYFCLLLTGLHDSWRKKKMAEW